MNSLALRGAAAFGFPVLALFLLAAGTELSETASILAAGPICGLAGGLAFGRRVGLPIVLGLCFGFIGSMFLLQGGRSPNFWDVVVTGVVSAFLFWTAGICATLALPAHTRFSGAYAFAVPGGLAGMTFQFFYGPAHFAFDSGSLSWWDNSLWPHFTLWLVAGCGTGYMLGRHLDRVRFQHDADLAHGKTPRRSAWAVASVFLGFLGLAISGLSFARYRLPLGLLESLSPAAAAADWLSSWGVLTLLVASIAIIHTFRKAPAFHGRSFAVIGMTLAVLMLAASQQIVAAPWKTRFNTSYAEKLLNGDRSPAADNAEAIYTGNLILAQAALDMDDNSNAAKYLLAAATTTGTRKIAQNGPDTSIARILLQRGERDAVLEYLRLCRNFWPAGIAVLERWERAIAAGRQPNFNNRSINPTDTSPGRR